MIIVENIKKEFIIADKNLLILRDISFQLDKGRIGVICGKSGTGKSTLLHLIGMLDEPTSGSININGFTLNEIKSRERPGFINTNIGFVFQTHNLIMELTAVENVAIPMLIKKWNKKKAFKRAEELLVDAGLGDRLNHNPFQLSGGETQRVNLCRAFINNPGIILADEPTGSLDYSTQENIINLIIKLQKKYTQTLLIVSHDRSLLELADDKFILENGFIEKN